MYVSHSISPVGIEGDSHESCLSRNPHSHPLSCYAPPPTRAAVIATPPHCVVVLIDHSLSLCSASFGKLWSQILEASNTNR